MIRKQGITVTVMVITVIILIILASTITVSMYSTINYSRLSTWATETLYIQEIVDEQLGITSATYFTTDTISLNVSNVGAEALNEQFSGETISVNNTIQLYKLDLGKLKITNTNYGNLESATDVYALSITTGRVYYVQGVDIDGNMYYSLTEGLKDRFNLTKSAGNLTSLVFVPSTLGYTNQPISVTVKVPNTYTNINISTTNSNITIGSQVVREKTYEYTINSNNIAGNYTITVSYNDGVKNLVSKYEVKGYDVTKPVIQELSKDNFIYKESETTALFYATRITATDESGIKIMKYELGTITEENAQEYFKNSGNIIVDGKINLDRANTIYTVYVEDMAGNYSVYTFDRENYISTEKWVQQGFTVTNGKQTLEIGDDIAYDETAGGTRQVTTNVDWKVLGADDDGNLLIMSASDVKAGFRLGDETRGSNLEKAQNDYITGIQQLNDECITYGYGEGVVGQARSITVEDVNKVTGYNPTTYGKGGVTQYGNVVTYKYNGTTKPAYSSAVASGTLSTEHSNGFYYYNGEKVVHVNDLTSGTNGNVFATLTSNYYAYYTPDLTTISKENNAKAYSMIFGSDDTKYWFASPYVSTYPNYTFFGMHIVYCGWITNGSEKGYGLFDSYGSADVGTYGIRAVVTLSSRIVFSGDSTNGWTY